MNVDENQKTPSQYPVMSIPNMLLMKGGKVIDTVVGAVPESALIPKIDALIKAP